MQTSLENLSGLERRLNFSVPLAEIDSEIETRLKKLARTVRLRGFRPGKVPLKIVAQQYGNQVRQEVVGDTLQRTFSDAVREQNLRIAGFPRFETKPVQQASGQFEYSATFEIYPEIQLGDLSGVTISRPVLQVTDTEVDKTIEILRRQRVTYEPVDRAAASGDQIAIDFHGTIGGEPFAGGHGHDVRVVLGGGQLLADFETQVIGLKAGETKTFDLTFPEDYHGKDVAGKTATFRVDLKEVAEPRIPEADAEFARSLGVEDGDVARMRDEIRANVEREVKRRIGAQVKEQVMQALLDSTPLDAPKALVDMEIQRLQDSARQDLRGRGVKDEDIALSPEMFEAQARRRVNVGLILAEFVKQQDLRAKPEQVRAIVEEHAQSYEHPEEVVKWFYSSRERLSDAESVAVEDNVVNYVLGVARVEDKPADFDELMANALPARNR